MRPLPTRILLTLALTLSTALIAVAAAQALSRLPHRQIQARFATPAMYRRAAQRAHAITYDRAVVPVGSWVRVTQSVNKWGGMDVRLQVRHLRAHARFRAEVHVGSCSASPSSAGPAFRNGPSRQDYAANEFWLDFRTDARGDASVLARRYWGIGRHQHAGSVVIHAPAARRAAACVTVPFRRIWAW